MAKTVITVGSCVSWEPADFAENVRRRFTTLEKLNTYNINAKLQVGGACAPSI
jgi:hypothetical protein